MLVTPITNVAPDGRDVGLVLGRAYEVIGVEADSYRILTDSDHPRFPNDPCLYEPEIFRVIDESEPDFWISEIGEDGERYAYPKEWIGACFFEDYHDRVPGIRKRFRDDLQRLYPRSWAKFQGGS
jgi:hypothetical protein